MHYTMRVNSSLAANIADELQSTANLPGSLKEGQSVFCYSTVISLSLTQCQEADFGQGLALCLGLLL